MIVVLIIVWSIATAAIARVAFGIGYNEGWHERQADMTVPPSSRKWAEQNEVNWK